MSNELKEKFVGFVINKSGIAGESKNGLITCLTCYGDDETASIDFIIVCRLLGRNKARSLRFIPRGNVEVYSSLTDEEVNNCTCCQCTRRLLG